MSKKKQSIAAKSSAPATMTKQDCSTPRQSYFVNTTETMAAVASAASQFTKPFSDDATAEENKQTADYNLKVIAIFMAGALILTAINKS